MQFKVFKRRMKDSLFGKTENTALDAQFEQMADARRGAVYFLAKTEVSKSAVFSTSFVDSFIINTEPLSDAKTLATKMLNKTNAGRKFVGALSVAGEATSAVIKTIKSYIAEFFKGLIDKVKSVYGGLLAGAEWITELGTWLVSEFAGNLSSLIPGWGYIQSISDFYSGLKQAILKSKDFITQVYAGRGVDLLGGHPKIIANALARHSMTGIAGGVKGMATSAASIGIEAAGDAAGGAGTIFAAVTGILERVVDLVDRLVQYTVVKKVCKKASKEWDKRGSQTSLVNDHRKFSEWFQSAVITTPVIAAMVMGSGFVAHPIKFLQLITLENRLDKALATDSFSSKYKAGVHYIEKLKELSGAYVGSFLDDYGISLSSSDGVVQARLTELTGGKALLDGHEFAVIPAWAIKTPEQAAAAQSALDELHASEDKVTADSNKRQANFERQAAAMNP